MYEEEREVQFVQFSNFASKILKVSVCFMFYMSMRTYFQCVSSTPWIWSVLNSFFIWSHMTYASFIYETICIDHAIP